ncbi:MAG: alkaline phosphatase family protein [Anaerolineales bacterium]
MKLLHIGLDGMNYPLFRKFLDEGCLPNFAQLVSRGTINRLMPSIPAWTPTNWAAQITGAHPGSHGLAGWSRRHKTDPMDAPPIQSWESREWPVETVWDVAEEAGLRCLITHYPVDTWPSPVEEGYVVAPGLRYPPFLLADAGEYFLSPDVGEEQREEIEGRVHSVDEVEWGAPPGSIPVRLEPADGWKNLQDEAWEATLSVPLNDGGEETFYILAQGEDLEKVGVYVQRDATQPMLELELGAWTSFAIRTFGDEEGSVRFRLLASSPTGPTLRLCRSQVYATEGFAYPQGLAGEIVEEVGPFFINYTLTPRGDAELEAFLDDVRYQGVWEARVAKLVQERYGWDVHFCHWHIFDFINHPTVNDIDPEGPDYDPQVAAWNMEAQRRAYQIADDVLADFLSLADEETYVMVASDHAMPPAHRWADINARLAECGLMAFDPATRRIDFSRSKTYTWPGRGAEVFINLEGREPTGIVPPEDYEAVQDEVIDALHSWRDPQTDRRVMALALRLQDAQIVGYWGVDSGDVICVYDHGMGWGAVYSPYRQMTEGQASVGPSHGAIHGSQLPTYETDLFTTMGMMILAGPEVKEDGYERDWRRWGLMQEIDVAPLACHLLGLRMPAHNQGTVPRDLLR